MKELFKHIRADKIVRWGMLIGALLILLDTIYILFSYLSLPPYIPLYNQMPWGENRLGARIEIFLPIVITAAFYILNLFMIIRMYEKTPLASRIISITTLLLTILSFIFVVRTLLLIL
jgi:hypothetical protein